MGWHEVRSSGSVEARVFSEAVAGMNIILEADAAVGVNSMRSCPACDCLIALAAGGAPNVVVVANDTAVL